MKILYVALKYDYGVVERGPSYEADNIEAGLVTWAVNAGHGVQCFYLDVKSTMTALEAVVKLGDFDCLLHVSFNEDMDLPYSVAMDAIKQGKKVIQFDPDASWRFHNWILPRKNRATDFITTHSSTIPWYEENGMRVIKSQWAGSPLYHPIDNLEKIYPVSFLGQKHGIRPQILQGLYNEGIEIHLFGNYWDGFSNWHGYLPNTESKVQAINQSKINLNLSNPFHVGTLPQIKGRHFEIPACRGFQISTPADNLKSYFEPDREIIICDSVKSLAQSIKFYLEHEEEREKIALNGYNRMMKDHLWQHRFEEIFK